MANKLYTEEQVKQMIEKSKETGLTAEYLILTTFPIELPTDEEIEKKFTIGNTEYPHKIEGAKWLKDKILNNGK